MYIYVYTHMLHIHMLYVCVYIYIYIYMLHIHMLQSDYHNNIS